MPAALSHNIFDVNAVLSCVKNKEDNFARFMSFEIDAFISCYKYTV
jgi:hypothetical protein